MAEQSDQPQGQSDFDRVGADRLRTIVGEFVTEMVDDAMIGFFFRQVDPERLAKFEYQFTARALGADIVYEGRPIGKAHRTHRIMGGQFARRTTILKQAFERHHVDAQIVARLMAHIESLRPMVTGQSDAQCAHQSAGGSLLTQWSPNSGQVEVDESWD